MNVKLVVVTHVSGTHFHTFGRESYKLTLTGTKYTSFEHLDGISLDFTISKRNKIGASLRKCAENYIC